MAALVSYDNIRLTTSDNTVERFFILSAEANIHDEESDKLSLQSLIIFCNKHHHLLFFIYLKLAKKLGSWIYSIV